ncbi:MAG: hypothetical protein Q9M13_07125 [Mariprofundales bacterium]|nr:hypothetical protein [Mariprofundales bacterium]
MSVNRTLYRAAILLLLTATISACGTVGSSINRAASRSSISFLHTYEVALKRFKSGHIMEARDHILRMERGRKNYKKALLLLKNQIEPARRRLLKHYSRAAAKAERRAQWTEALTLYRQAARFSLSNSRLLKRVRRMDLRVRQLRMSTLIKQHRREDRALLSWANSYRAPKGLTSNDPLLTRHQRHRQELVEEMATEAYREASRSLLRGYPAAAYAEIESHLRLEPASRKGAKLRARIIAALPKGIKIPRQAGVKRRTRAAEHIGIVTTGQIKELLKNGKLLKAKRYALYYRRQDGKGAKALVKQVQAAISAEAAQAFAKGRQAFRNEQLVDAVTNWRRASQLMPSNTEYSDSLLRAQQLLERLKILSSPP